MGTQDSFGEAQDFMAVYGTQSFTMIWDSTFQTWQELGVRGQPAGMLLTSGGEIVAQWSGGIPVDQVLEEAAKLP